VIRELSDLGEVRAACGDDDLLVWAAQELTGGARAWALGEAVVAAAPGVSRRDRLAVWGDPSRAVELVRHALAELGPTFRPFGETGLVREVVGALDGVRERAQFSWMSLPDVPRHVPRVAPDGVGWLGPEADAEVAALLAGAAPASYAVPGAAGVRRWAGVRAGGELAAVAADAWSAPSVGLLAGVATAAPFRGRGLAERVCGWVSAQLVARHGRAALMVDDANVAAIKVYERIGYRRRRVLAAHVAA
jgi:ribosomal protein S18 acetylase RimI-like enzyme